MGGGAIPSGVLLITTTYRHAPQGPTGSFRENNGTILADRLVIALALTPYTASSPGCRPPVDTAARSEHE
jgi:hypothetical protein